MNCPLGKYLIWPLGDDKSIDHLPSCREWGKFVIYFLYIISWDHKPLVYSILQEYISSVSMTSISVKLFFFFLSISLLLSNPESSFYPSSFNSYCLFCPVLSPWNLSIYCLSSYWPVAFYTFPSINISACQEPTVEAAHADHLPCCQLPVLLTTNLVLK